MIAAATTSATAQPKDAPPGPKDTPEAAPGPKDTPETAPGPADPGAATPEQTPTPDAASADTPGDASQARPDRRDDPAWILYHSAYSEVARGQPDKARALLSELLRDYPDHPAAAAGARVASSLGVQGPGTATTQDDEDYMRVVEQPSAGARAELALFQSLHGIALGVELCIVLDCDSGEAFLGLSLLGGAGALSASLLLPGDKVTPGQRALLNSGTAWGAYNALMVLLATDVNDDQRITTALMGGQLAGLGIGQALWATAAPSEGQVALANTFGIWSSVLTLMGLDFLGGYDEETTSRIMLMISNLGLVAGGYTAYRYPTVSRGHTLLIDAGGILGALGGWGSAILVAGNTRDDSSLTGAMFLGAVVGLGSAAYLTRDWDVHDTPPVRLSLMPHRDGGLMAGVAFDL